MRGRWLFPLFLLITLGAPPASFPQEPNTVRELEAAQKKLQEAQGKATMPAKESLKRRDVKGQSLSASQAEMEGLTPEQKKMYEDIQRQLGEIRENARKRDAALEELSR
jgi:hypothetical protein